MRESDLVLRQADALTLGRCAGLRTSAGKGCASADDGTTDDSGCNHWLLFLAQELPEHQFGGFEAGRLKQRSRIFRVARLDADLHEIDAAPRAFLFPCFEQQRTAVQAAKVWRHVENIRRAGQA